MGTVYSTGIAHLKAAEEGCREITRLLRKDDFVRANLTFAELDDDITVLRVVEERSGKTVCRCHDEVLREESVQLNGKMKWWKLRAECMKSGLLEEE